MDTRNGNIVTQDEIKFIPRAERRFFIPMTTIPTQTQLDYKQIAPYDPCGCGSGKKFKFCCRGKIK